MANEKIGLGGGCHWCTEAVFEAVKGVTETKQGFIASEGDAANFSEAVIVVFNPEQVSLEKLIEIHLATHKSTVRHSFRKKYRSAIYYYNKEQQVISTEHIKELQQYQRDAIITQVLPFNKFKASRVSIQNYYRKNPEAPFCSRYILPKLHIVNKNFKEVLRSDSKLQ